MRFSSRQKAVSVYADKYSSAYPFYRYGTLDDQSKHRDRPEPEDIPRAARLKEGCPFRLRLGGRRGEALSIDGRGDPGAQCGPAGG